MNPLLFLAGVCLVAAGQDSPAVEVYEETFISVVDNLELRDARTDKRVGVAELGSVFLHDSREKAGKYSMWYSRKNITVDRTALRTPDEAKIFFDDRLRKRESAADYTARARILHVLEKDEAAIADLDRALALDDKRVEAWMLRADCRTTLLRAERDLTRYRALREQALSDAEQAVRLRPDDFRVYVTRFLVNLHIDVDTALDDIATIVRLAPDYAPAYNNRAKIYVDLKREAEALVELNHALMLDPEYSDAYTNRGIIFHHRKQFDSAIADASQAARFNPLNTSAWNNRAIAYKETGEFEKALADFSEYVRLAPLLSDGYAGRGEVYLAMGVVERDAKKEPFGKELFEKALAECDAALGRNPADYGCRNTKGAVLKALKRTKDAVAFYDETLTRMRKDPFVTASGDWPRLEQILDHGATWPAEQPAYYWRNKFADLFDGRADAYRSLWLVGDEAGAAQAEEDWDRALRLRPENADFWRNRAGFRLARKNFSDAYSDLNEALSISPDDVEALRLFVEAATGAKQYDDAWYAVGRLRELKAPPADEELAELKRASGRDK
jgi:tetratricopeptide (TPR) repeat protein